MQKLSIHLFSAILLIFFSSQAFAQLPDFTGIVERAKDSVVNISTSKKIKTGSLKKHLEMPELPEGSPFGELFKKFFDHDGGFGFKDRDTSSLGSGFIISKDGYVLTNHHVIEGADEVIVRLTNREEHEARVIGSDKDSDIALLKIEGENFPTLTFGDSNVLKVGEWVLAIGSPFGFDHTVTAGIVSAKGRSLPSDNYVPFIQTDVAINPGNSGGPLFNMNGEVIGINSQIYSRSGGFMGLSFAIPIEMAVDVAEQIKNTGKVSRGWLGVLIQEVTGELADSFGMTNPHGALIAKVLDDSPAQKAGLQVGDVIVEFNGKKVTRSSSLPPIVGRTPVNENAKVTLIRNRSRMTLNVKIAQLPEDITQAKAEPEVKQEENKTTLGMVVKKLDKAMQRELKVDAGVLVEQVDEDSPAKMAGIRKGDVISMLDNHSINSVDEFEDIAARLKSGKSVAILIQRSNGPVFLAIKP
ncbi:MAG: DegQ family serine endoprotease [Gammaproteobacteria bacterium]|nr:DegQ family serine endoprotease [Gammaproteobacteria bacterium]MBL6998903.1 DegQ family serine endoprotease [Gammaproteobacteria bacterium]